MSRKTKLRKLERRRQRGLPTRRFSVFPGEADERMPGKVALNHYAITFEPIEDNDGRAQDMRRVIGDDRMAELHDMVFEEPKRALLELKQLLDRNPDLPILYNWLATCHQLMGEMEEAERIILLNYEQNPTYLFARLNYAHVLLGRGELDKVVEVMDGKWDLKLLYPARNEFHVTEFIAFAAVSIQFHLRTGNFETADSCYSVLKRIAPDHDTTLQMKPIVEGAQLLRLAQAMLTGRKRFPAV